MMTYKLYIQSAEEYFSQRLITVSFALIAAACAANSKTQIIPVVFFVLAFTLIRIFYLEILVQKSNYKSWKKVLSYTLTFGLVLVIIFASAIKNIVLFGNPAYPIEVSFLGHSLNYLEPSMRGEIPDYLAKAPHWRAWIYSIFEVNTFDPNRYLPWTVDQGFLSEMSNSKGWRMGGYFSPYVIFQLIIFTYFSKRYWQQREIVSGLALMSIMTVVTSVLPQSHQLRYYMYWIICLISINLFWVFNQVRPDQLLPKKNVSPLGFVGVCLFLLVCVISVTKAQYVIPKFYSLEEHISSVVKPSIISQINSGDMVYIVGQRPHTFFYAKEFHGVRNYSVYEVADGTCQENSQIKKQMNLREFKCLPNI
jgi:hypothetical protein